MKLTNLPAEKRTVEWIRSEIAYQCKPGVHTYCPCRHCGESSRGGCCAECWGEYLELVRKAAKGNR